MKNGSHIAVAFVALLGAQFGPALNRTTGLLFRACARCIWLGGIPPCSPPRLLSTLLPSLPSYTPAHPPTHQRQQQQRQRQQRRRQRTTTTATTTTTTTTTTAATTTTTTATTTQWIASGWSKSASSIFMRKESACDLCLDSCCSAVASLDSQTCLQRVLLKENNLCSSVVRRASRKELRIIKKMLLYWPRISTYSLQDQ